MADNRNNDFFLEQQRAVERMRATANRSRYGQPTATKPAAPPPTREAAAPPPAKTEAQPRRHTDSLDSIISRLNIPFLNRVKSDSDTALIIGLILLLTAENSDRLLLLALIYILM